ncbi:helix-turn-helix transcriptional regulator [Sinomonas sp. JGH33]|uniref:Helix-turn-helix transcriptional regulator n=1 Tax=Sinomonas terricola TaxID=3110330 RepID=A0ABU5T4Q7_9MICC|nr:helix-turn-helix transcriptional regulator [Sinomonas sp. JGH33]MEA5454499.1 helix-turn-helix transcriptional regulator [Sinomonas sp. JGH33]
METPSTPTQAVAAVVREALARRKITDTALSEATGIPSATLSRRLSGGKKAFDVDELYAIAEFLEASPADLLARATALLPSQPSPVITRVA